MVLWHEHLRAAKSFSNMNVNKYIDWWSFSYFLFVVFCYPFIPQSKWLTKQHTCCLDSWNSQQGNSRSLKILADFWANRALEICWASERPTRPDFSFFPDVRRCRKFVRNSSRKVFLVWSPRSQLDELGCFLAEPAISWRHSVPAWLLHSLRCLPSAWGFRSNETPKAGKSFPLQALANCCTGWSNTSHARHTLVLTLLTTRLKQMWGSRRSA